MTEETNSPTVGSEGQAPAAPSEGSASTGAPTPESGQANGSNQTATDNGQSIDDMIFDPAEFEKGLAQLPDNVKAQAVALRKQLQKAFTQKTQAIADQRKKIEAYDSFNRDPHGTLANLAQQLGYNLSRGGQSQVPGNAQQGWTPEAGDPETWNDVENYFMQKAMERVRSEFGEQLQPIMKEFQAIKKESIEKQLSEIDPSWATYEDVMMENLSRHPSLANDPAGLYRLSVPSEILESRATQRALARLEGRAKSSQVGGTSTTNRKPNMGALPNKPMTFEEAVTAARAKLADEGLVPK